MSKHTRMHCCIIGDLTAQRSTLLDNYDQCSRYNNKTYRIDDIDFDKNPLTKFKTRDGSEISFVDYYKKVSGCHLYTFSPLPVSIVAASMNFFSSCVDL